MNVLSINQLSKSYGKIKALSSLNLEIESGQVFGLLGPNGSGKTTTLGIILGILGQDSGSFEWFGGKYGNYSRKHIGAILETPNFYPYLDADHNLDIIAHIREVDDRKFDEVLELVNLKERRKSPFSTYSLGMKQRLAIAATLIGDPEVVIFDEPTNGLDPQGIAEVRHILRRIADTGKTVIMASHLLDEVEKICSHVGILRKGILLDTGSVGSIINSDIAVEIAAHDMEGLKKWLSEISIAKRIDYDGKMVEIIVDKDTDIAEINKAAHDHGILLSHINAKRKRLETEFLEIISKSDNQKV
jgi:ABC-2 type transport system ATP-binding protein